jgi:ParB family chromosome partitioning protein
MDEALAYFQLLEEFQLTQEQVAERVGKDRATVANYLRLLRLPQVVIEDLKGQVLSFGHGKALLGLDDNELCLKARSIIIENKLSVRATEALCDEIKTNAAAAAQTSETNTEAVPLTPVQSRLSSAALDLSRQWSTKIEIKGSERRGKIVLHYSSRQDLDRILHGMQNSGVWAEQQT